MYKTDIEIAQECTMRPITERAAAAGVGDEYLEQYGRYKAKVDYKLLKDRAGEKNGKLILVTAINPTPAGEGKTTTTVGLADALRKIGGESPRHLDPALHLHKAVPCVDADGDRLAAILGDEAAAGGADKKVIDGLMAMVLEQRAAAKAAKDWATSDRIRDNLKALGIQVKDTKDGAEWTLGE